MSKSLRNAPTLFALRDDLALAMAERLSVDDQGTIHGHDAAAEEIIVRLADFLSQEDAHNAGATGCDQ